MGVTGLWTVLQPCARPIKLETLNKKRLAVDASIWIYQFLKAVRDKEGNALRNSHVVGFFRRICKLLFFGIKPVFVFDGGAPALKRQTINARRQRREGRRDDAARTAGKLLAVQMHRRAEEEERKRKEEADGRRRRREEEEVVPDNTEELVYVDEIGMSAQERKKNRGFKKKDQYHLPEMDVSFAEMGQPNDPRIMSQEELEEYARQFHTGEEVNFYDFSKIDFESPFFQSLPASDRYNILNAARLRSRLRMGYSKEQLDTMFPDRMAFSRFQIDRVRERNELTQRLMNLNGMNGEDFGLNGRVAGEKGKEYVLVKNDGVEGGWALGVVSNKNEGQRDQPIDVDTLGNKLKTGISDEWEDEDAFEDVPIEGLNRLPKASALEDKEAMEQRRALYKQRQKAANPVQPATKPIDEDPESLFVPDVPAQSDDEDVDGLFEDVLPPAPDSEDDDLQRAIAMSLEQPDEESLLDAEKANRAAMLNGPRIDEPLEFNAKNAKAGRAFAQVTNARANGTVSGPFAQDSDGESDGELQEALKESKQASRKFPSKDTSDLRSSSQAGATNTSQNHGFEGPLPFESLNLGKSILGKRKKKPVEEEGGFERPEDKKAPEPLPPWFSADAQEGYNAQKVIEDRQFDGGNPENRAQQSSYNPILRRRPTKEVIDLEEVGDREKEVIEVGSEDEEWGEDNDVEMGEMRPVESKAMMDDVADAVRAEPPVSTAPATNVEMRDAAEELQNNAPNEALENTVEKLKDNVEEPRSPAGDKPEPRSSQVQDQDPNGKEGDEEELEWSESDVEGEVRGWEKKQDTTSPTQGSPRVQSSKSSSPEFENVEIPQQADPKELSLPVKPHSPPPLPQDDTFDRLPVDDSIPIEDEDEFSDPEDEELMRQLAVEAEEHARFAAELSSKSHLQSAEEYERELKQLRNQQKKDRRDADEVTQIMITECQQLLALFGLPYITAPMEAEAQCAELVTLGLVDGIVTDDSDIFLFGGTRVYKNMFNQAKFVECYLASDLEKEYSLTREKIIQAAHLLGSDYTEGLPSVGPVTALEILSEFVSLDAFRDWWTDVQRGIPLSDSDNASPFRRKFKKNATKLFLPPAFPDRRVDEAYLKPDVDSDPSAFAWGVPDLDALRRYLMATVGWSQERADEILVPVVRDMNRRDVEGTQTNITQFFGGQVGSGTAVRRDGKAGGGDGGGGGAFAPRRKVVGKSRRMEDALGRLHARARNLTVGEEEDAGEGDGGEGGREEEEEGGSRIVRGMRAERPKKQRGKRTAAAVREEQGGEGSSDGGGDGDSGDGDEGYRPPRKAPRKRTKRGGKKV